MINITENTRRFIENASIDYYTYFIKAWIPFNSWYKQKWTDIYSDRAAINKIKDSSNEARSTIVNFIEGDGDNAKTFQSYLSTLHYQLLENTIENKGNRITFQNVVVGKNRTKIIDESYNRLKYYLERKDNQFGVKELIIKIFSSNNIMKYNPIIQKKYDKEELTEDREFQKMSTSQQNQVLRYYDELIPNISLNLIESSSSNKVIKIGSFNFIDNTEKITQGLIEIIYSLRCVLFHGELNPNEANNEVYKNVYNILYMILLKLR